ncbi:thioesterase family protein [Streptomyces sp. TRM64462]|uniref:acyl-CoA thioesterase n=1 Tax=Streptomyces sp. TRM64462 TaxID=2741726 RepID=UPI0015869A3A|nr:acyl-CoA thioesterase [Streptomyces sp. TRM64462]
MTHPAYVHRHHVPFEETNLTGNVYFAHYVRWQGHCRESFLAEHAPRTVAALDDGLALVTVACGMEYLRECRALDDIDIHMSLRHVAGSRVTMDFAYWRAAPGPRELVARGHQTIACMRRRDGDRMEPEPVPLELRAALEPYQPIAAVL